MTQQQQKTEQKSIDLVKIAAGAFAAMASAVLLSTLGAGGTVAGAALGSVIVTVATSAFSKGIDVSKQGVSAAQSMAMRRVARARSQVGRATDEMDSSTRAQQRLAAANAELDAAESDLRASGDEPAPARGEPESGSGWRDRLTGLSWKRVALVAAGLFLVAMVVITGFELLSGRAVSSLTGGSSDSPRTSFSGLTGEGKSSPTPTPTPTPTATTSGAPSESPSESVSESPDDAASQSPSVEPSESATTSAPTETSDPDATDTTVPQDPASPSP